METVGYDLISAVLADIKADGLKPPDAATIRRLVSDGNIRAMRIGAANSALYVNVEDAVNGPLSHASGPPA